MNRSNYSEAMPQKSYSYGSPMKYMRNSCYSYNGSIASNSNGFYPTAVSTPAYKQQNPNVKITSKAEEMMRRTEEMSRQHSLNYSNNEELIRIKEKLDLSDTRLAMINKYNVSHCFSNLVFIIECKSK